MDEGSIESPSKRRRLSSSWRGQAHDSDSYAFDPDHQHAFQVEVKGEKGPEKDENILITSTSKLASQTIAPFLVKHIPQQYAPQGVGDTPTGVRKDPNTKYCYRHHPDLNCRRQADEPSMEQLQHELQSLSQSDQQGIAHVWALFSAAPAKHRNLMLQGILTQCCFPQLSFLSAHIRDLIRIDFLSALPTELGFKILRHLDTNSLCKAAQVSRRWRTMADDDVVWHRMCEQHIARKCQKCGWGLPLLERKRLMASKEEIIKKASGMADQASTSVAPKSLSPQDSADKKGDGEVSAEASPGPSQGVSEDKSQPGGKEPSGLSQRFRPWKDVYKTRFEIGSNWRHGRYAVKIFRGHTNGVMCLQFDDTTLATGSYDCTIKIWDIKTGRELRTLRGHTSGIRSLQFDGNKLISGSLDATLKVWNWRTGDCLRTLSGHGGGVISLHFAGRLLASGSVDKTIRIWDFEDACTTVLRGHTDWVNAVRIDLPSRTLFSASDDLTVRLWDLDTKRTIRIFKGHVGHVQQVLPLPAEFDVEGMDSDPASSPPGVGSEAGGSHDSRESTPFEFPSSRSREEAFGPGFSSSNADRPLPPRYMLTSGLDGTIRLWDVHTGRCLRTSFGHVEGIWALAADALRFVSGAEDRMVKVWDGRTGKCERTFTWHQGPVTCMGLSDSRMCTGSEDGEVRMLSFNYFRRLGPGGTASAGVLQLTNELTNEV